MRLNIGSGQYPADGWVNLDHDPTVNPDILADLQKLPDEIRDVETVYLGHVLTDIPPDQLIGTLNDLWKRCRPGAQVCATAPDIAKVWDAVINGQLDISTAVAMGGATRRWVATEQRLLESMRASGLRWARPVSIASPDLNDWPLVSRVGWQCAVIGTVR